jgi:hypothetical protein
MAAKVGFLLVALLVLLGVVFSPVSGVHKRFAPSVSGVQAAFQPPDPCWGCYPPQPLLLPDPEWFPPEPA